MDRQWPHKGQLIPLIWKWLRLVSSLPPRRAHNGDYDSLLKQLPGRCFSRMGGKLPSRAWGEGLRWQRYTPSVCTPAGERYVITVGIRIVIHRTLCSANVRPGRTVNAIGPGSGLVLSDNKPLPRHETTILSVVSTWTNIGHVLCRHMASIGGIILIPIIIHAYCHNILEVLYL